MSGLTRLSIRRLIVRAALLATLIVPGFAPQAAQASAACAEPQVKIGTRWLIPLWDGDCARLSRTFTANSETLSDNSRAERFEVPLIDATCLQASINSADFTPDIYIYDDPNYSHEVGVFQQKGGQASSVVRLPRGGPAMATSDGSVPVYYVLATSFGPGAQFGKYTLDLRTC